MVELMREWLSAAAHRNATDVITRVGINDPDVIGHCGIARVRRHANFYELEENGCLAVIVPVIKFGELVDLVAFLPEQPERFRTRLGTCGLLGGDSDVTYSLPLQVSRTPLGWLQAGCEGVVVLDWKLARGDLSFVQDLIVEDQRHADEINQHIRVPPKIPKITWPTELAA